jgi:uncharacterized phiE125 gp8 family phage protein
MASSTYGYVSYATRKLAVSSPPQSFAEPISLAEVKSYMKLPTRITPDPAEDAELNMLITAARVQAEICQGRDLVRKQWDLSLDYWPAGEIPLTAPLVSCDLVQFRDYTGTVGDLTEGVDYLVDTFREPGVIMPPYNSIWRTYTPWPSSSILVRFTSGFDPADVWWLSSGQMVRRGMLMLVHEWFMKKLPFMAVNSIQELPYGLSCALRQGALLNVC